MADDPVKQITKLIWSWGNYEEIAKQTIAAARALVDAAGVSDGDEVLDVATGNGNVAVLAAQQGARVFGCDLTPAMIDLARKRAYESDLKIEFLEADAEQLPYEDDRFDHVLSVFGAMFAPHPDVAAAEMFRVARPGGIVGMANWMPEGLIGRQTRLMQSYAPAQPEAEATDWGREDFVAEKFGPLSEAVETQHHFIREEYESLDALEEWALTNVGPAIVLKQVLAPDLFYKLREELRELYSEFNQASDGTVVVDAEYLLVVARKR